jgi:hypothetical protein
MYWHTIRPPAARKLVVSGGIASAEPARARTAIATKGPAVRGTPSAYPLSMIE